MNKIDGGLNCPKCGKPLHFGMDTSKYACEACNALWSFDLQGNKMVWQEWKIAEKGSIMYDFIMATAVWDDDKHNKEDKK